MVCALSVRLLRLLRLNFLSLARSGLAPTSLRKFFVSCVLSFRLLRLLRLNFLSLEASGLAPMPLRIFFFLIFEA